MPLICDEESVEAFGGVVAFTGALDRVWETRPSEIDDGTARLVGVLGKALVVSDLPGVTDVFVSETGDVRKTDWLNSGKDNVDLASVVGCVITCDVEELAISIETML